jgi:hypothetical protein
MWRVVILSAGLLVAGAGPVAHAQNWSIVEGLVREAPSGLPLPGVTVVVSGTNYGTVTNTEGWYSLRIPAGRWTLRYSFVGYQPQTDSVVVARDQVLRLDKRLSLDLIQLQGVTVSDSAVTEVGVYQIDPQDIQNIPDPFRDVFRALKVAPGVASNNELSNQYSVRGGGYNENLIFLNGFEVYMPFRPRQGEQEGLGLLNPDLAGSITFYTGGFPARYGGKLSSALDVQYVRPEGEPLSGSAYVSLLDAGAAAGASAFGGRLGWVFGLRKAQAHRFFSTQELKGNYQPDFTDLQGSVSLRLSPGHEIEALGIMADHEFVLDPSSRKTYFGTISLNPGVPSNLRSLWVSYSDNSLERDGYTTRFGGLRLKNILSSRIRTEHDVSVFRTTETESYNLSGSSVLYQVEVGGNDPGTGEGHFPVGNARQDDFADNRIEVATLMGQGRWIYVAGRHAPEAGWYARRLEFEDAISEESSVSGRTAEGDPVRIVADSINDASSLAAAQAGFYVQDAVDVLPERDRLVISGGIRADYFSFNGEWTVSPRLSTRFRLNDETLLFGSLGLYYQTPTYRELRGNPESSIEDALNEDILSQRSLQFVAGAEHFLPEKRLYLRAEAYWKSLSRLISYDVQNVRIRYSGHNDSNGYAYGLDTQLRGEFVPGLESWVNYSFMVARERFLPAFHTEYNTGLIARPMDQRHTFSAYMQDYVPGDRTWKIHLRALFGSGLPYTPPVPGEEQLGNIVEQAPGPRSSARFIEYRRIDAGVSKEIVLGQALSRPVRIQLTGEVLNIFDMVNTVSYTWTPGADGIWNRVPTRLTPRTLNVRLRVEF